MEVKEVQRLEFILQVNVTEDITLTEESHGAEILPD